VPATIPALLVEIVTLVILWVVVSIPVYAAGKLITSGRTGFGSAMGATLGGALVYLIILFGVAFLLTPFLGTFAPILGFLLAIIGWLAVYRASFSTGWLGALGIVVLAWLVLVVIDVILTTLFGIRIPKFYPF